MSQVAEQLKTQLAELSAGDRAELAQFLIGSLDERVEEDARAAWHQEVTRRVAEIKSGQVVGIPAEDVFESIRKKYS